MKNIHGKFKGQKANKKKDQFGKQQFNKVVNKGMMKRWKNNKNMGRGKT